MNKNLTRGLSSHSLKLIAAAAMLADHFAWLFLNTFSVAGQLLHFVGRTTIPIMCFFIAQGFNQTRSRTKYAVRLAVFAVISQIPFHYFLTGNLSVFSSPIRLNVMFTLLFALLSLVVLDQLRDRPAGWLCLFILTLLASFADWSIFAIIFTVIFAQNRHNPQRQMLLYSVAAIVTASFFAFSSTSQEGAPFWSGFFQFGLLLAVPLLPSYNGQRGTSPAGKWFFYLFYPLHLIVLKVIHQFAI
ncbi:MAG: TraX family protein [Clostridium sp.]|uniref:TraX family protein n=1 Tax=Clostridium sp. TaxID=1506 RepID=UPI0029076311|nr:TraX family protein [Clostridium sp.]MDU7337374.1 TraX family protein [Clostridium sp.]